MALYNNLSMDDYNRMAARAKRDAAEKAAQNLANRQAAVQAANKKTGGLVDTLVGIGTGIKDKVVDAGATLANMGKTVVGGIDELFANNATKSTMSDDSKRRNEIAQKYGYASYSDAAKDDNASQDFWNEIKSSNKKTQDTLKSDRKTYENSVGNVQDINLNKAAGQALNTIDTVGMALGGGAGVAANILGGGLAGIGDQYKADAERGKTTLDLDNFSLKNAATGMAGGAAGSLAGGVLGKAATKASNPLAKALTSQLGQGIGSGAAAGAAGGFTSTLTQGGTLENALANALEGAKGGAVGGGVMAGTMGLAGKGLNRLQNGRTANVVEAEPVDAQIVAKNKIQAPKQQLLEAEVAEPTTTPRGITIKDLNAGVEEIPVKTVVDTPSRGKYIDSVVDRVKANLPESKKTAAQILYDTTNGKYGNAAEMLAGKTAADSGQFGGYANEALADYFPKDLVTAIRSGAREIHGLQTPFDAYGMSSRQDLPLLNRQEYYHDRSGKPGASIVSEDIPAYMQDRMRNDAGKYSYSSYDNETIMRDVFGDNMDKEQMYDLYEQLAQTTIDPKIYSDDNLGAALAIDPELNRRATQILADQTRKNIAVQGGPAIADTIPVADRTTRYTENTLPARTYEQPTARANKVMNAEPTTVKATPTTTAVAEAPTTRQVAVDPETQARLERQIYEAKQRQGQSLLDQYGTLERPYRRMVGGDPAGVLNTLYDDYGLKTPAEVQYAANHVTGKDGTVSKMTRQLAASAENVPTAITESWLNNILADNGLTEAEMKSIKSQVQAVLNRTGENGYSDGATTLQVIKNLEGKIRDIKGQSGTYHNMSYADKCRASALQSVRDELTDRLWANADISKVMTDKNLNELRAMYKDNPTWQNFVNNKLAKAKDGAEMRALMKPLVNGGHIIEGAQMTAGSVGEKLAGAAAKAGSAKGAAKNVLSVGIDMVFNSDKAKQKRAESYARQAKNAEAQLYGETPVTNTGTIDAIKQKAGKAGETVANIASKTAEKVGKATAGLNDTTLSGMALGGSTVGDMLAKTTNRSIAKDQAEFANNRANVAQKTAEFEQAANDYTQAVAEQQAAENQLAQGTSSASGTANMLARINNAMELAMQAGDINAYSQLADLYKQAYNIYEMQNPQAKNEGKALSANQSKALAASQQLEQLAQMTPNAGTVASTIPVLGGIVDLTGGNEYANQAEALATTLGYLLSGANIKESEAKRIGQSYVPNAFDSEAVRQQKLDRARQLIQSYMSDTGAIQQ